MIEKLETQNDLVEIFEKYNSAVYNFVFHKVYYNKELAEDIAQEVFIKAWNAKVRFDPQKAKMKTWLLVIAKNLVIDHFRKKSSQIHSEIEEDFNIQDSTLEGSLDTEILKEYVRSMMSKLKEEDKELLIMRYINEFDINEICEIVGKDYNSTKVSIHRAVKKLKELINNEEKTD